MDNIFNPSQLLVARQRRKFTKKALANVIGLSQKSIVNFEIGTHLPSEESLGRIAEALNFPVEFFLRPDMELPTSSNASFRSFSRMTSGQRDAALAAGGIAFQLSEWIDVHFHLPLVDVPDLAEYTPEAAAEALRNTWSLGVLPIKNMVHLLESKGVRVFSLVEDSREVNAFSSWKSGNVPFVFLNTVKSAESSRFDSAHELGHLVLHRHGDPKGKEAESEANAFASAFLMPKSEVLASGWKCKSIPDVLSLKKRWNVSAMALVYRMHKVSVLSDWLYRSMCMELSSKGFRTHEEGGVERETSLVLRKVFDALRVKGRGVLDIAKELMIPAEEIHKLIFGLVSVALGADNQSPMKSPRRSGHLRLVK